MAQHWRWGVGTTNSLEAAPMPLPAATRLPSVVLVSPSATSEEPALGHRTTPPRRAPKGGNTLRPGSQKLPCRGARELGRACMSQSSEDDRHSTQAGAAAKLSFLILLALGYLRSEASPTRRRNFTRYHVKSTCHHLRPWRQLVSKAWWLLCHPSPKARMPTTQLFIELSVVFQSLKPHTWLTEFTAQVMCQTQTTRAKKPHSTQGRPPNR
mmetsp:Transcript_95886/g.271068  ORF Transcript_95886/g.271068 Transcript_95886/m.271068 type:complete len:211 (+) Transcript_95886:428-1060(+)